MRPRFSFDDVVLDLEGFRLTRGGREVHLEPKVLELLGYLVQHRGRLVEKAELQGAVWSDTAVSESALTRAVAQLRKALDDDAREARYVETVPTRGYRFRPDVRVREARHEPTSPQTAPRRATRARRDARRFSRDSRPPPWRSPSPSAGSTPSEPAARAPPHARPGASTTARA